MRPERRHGEPESPEESSLLDYQLLREFGGFVLWRAPGRHKLLVATCFAAVVALAVAALLVLPKRWEVRASILAQSNPLMPATREVDRTSAEREIVQRRDNIASLVAQTDFLRRHQASRSPASLLRDRLFTALRGRELTDEERLEGTIDALQERLWVLTGNEGTITFGLQWTNPELALDVVKAALQSFLNARRQVEVSSFSETIAILEVHSATAQREIAAISERLEAKQQALHGASTRKRAPVRIRPPPDADVAKLDALLEAKRRALRVMEEYRDRRVADLNAELAQQQLVYAPAHPILVVTKRNLDALSQRPPEAEALRVEISDLEREIKSRGSRPGDAVKLAAEDLSAARLQLDEEDPRLEQERHELRLAFRNFSSLQADIAAARIGLDTANLGFKYRYSVLSPPQMPRGFIWPNRLRIMVMAVAGGVAFALFAAVAADLRTGLVIERWQLTSLHGVPLLGEVSRSGPKA